ncbi:MAG TPA: sigma-70 family RNA polymerase sigma factor, partial [Bdellovibrionales bacterium]|nr:sigma-70 family RNA polymerase sigma factor [Bdellovibrionales bacterium]
FEPRLLRYTMRFLPEQVAREVVQDTFLKLWQIDASFTEDRVAQWLYTVCRNRALDILKQEKRMVPAGAHLDDLVSAFDPAAGLEARERHELVVSFLRLLSEKEREIVRLKFQDGLKYSQIAAITGLSPSHVGVIIHNAVLHLRQKIAARAKAAGKEAL